MSISAAFLLAAAVAQSGAMEAGEQRGQGAQVASARVAVQILRPAVLRNGQVVSGDGERALRTQRVQREGRVTHEFE